MTPHENEHPAALAAKLTNVTDALAPYTSGTMAEVRELARMLDALAPHALSDGWRVSAAW